MARTLHDRFVMALKARGERVVEPHPASSGRYTKMTCDVGGYYFIGRSGALRYGRCSSDSQGASEQFKAHLLLKA